MPTFGSLAARNARTWPGKDAFVELDRRVAWGAFDRRSDALGHALRIFGVAPGDRVAILAADCIETAETFIACAKIGAVRVGLNPRFAPREIAALIADCAPKVVFVQAGQEETLAAAGAAEARIIPFGDGAGSEYEALIRRHGDGPALVQTPFVTVMIAYTTGSTGLPKGAVYRHGDFLASILYTVLYEGATHDAVWLHAMPAAGIPVMHMLRNLYHGATTVIVGPWQAERALHLIERERTTNTVLVPTMLNTLLGSADLGRRDVSSMRLLGYGASPLPPATIREAMRAFSCPFLQMYGTTELCGMALMLFPSDHDLGIASRPEILASAGLPLAFVETRIVDDIRRDVAPGEIGELIIRSEVMVPGYWQAPSMTRETFVDGWLHTGDMARADRDGYVYLSDRAKFRIKTGGYNVFPTEVENALAEHPSVDEAAVFGLPDAVWGERIHAVVSLKPGATAEPEALRAFCRDRIAGFKIPKDIDIWPELPKGATGKIQKRSIIERFAARPSGDGEAP
jgi:acyl-CoA synthetase (AMP-forming)/AMP-acid ligase II